MQKGSEDIEKCREAFTSTACWESPQRFVPESIHWGVLSKSRPISIWGRSSVEPSKSDYPDGVRWKAGSPIRMDGEYLVGDISDLFEDTVRSNVDKDPEAGMPGMQVLFQGCSSHVLQILQICWQGEDREYG